MGCRIQSRAVTAVDASVGVDETFGLRPVVKVVAAWRAGDAGATLAVGLAAGVADVEHNGAGLGDIQAAGSLAQNVEWSGARVMPCHEDRGQDLAQRQDRYINTESQTRHGMR